MGGRSVAAALCSERPLLLHQLTHSTILEALLLRKILSPEDHEYIANIPDDEKKCEFFLEIVAKQNRTGLHIICEELRKQCPKLARLLHQPLEQNRTAAQEPPKGNMIVECNTNRESSSPNCRSSRGGSITPQPNSRRCSMSPENVPPLNHTIELYTEPVVEDDDVIMPKGDGRRRSSSTTGRHHYHQRQSRYRSKGNSAGGQSGSGAAWETHRVSVSRVPGYGFGIAVSGGRDNPHFANGDPSIAVSDVLKSGPAEDLLQVNDRIISVNGISLENVEYATAVQVLRDSGNTVSLTIKRRVTPPTPVPSSTPSTLKFTLTKASKKEDFGIVLGCRLYIKELSPKAREQLNSAGQCLNEGDVISKINSNPCNDMSLKEARKIIESCKDRLNLVVLRESRNLSNSASNSFHEQTYSQNNNYSSDPVNAYSGQNLYVAPPSRSTLIGDSIGNGSVNGMQSPGGVGRSRGPLPATHDSPSENHQHIHPPRPPPPRPEDYYSSRRQLYEEDPLNQRNKPTSEPRLISFQKEGSVGLRLTGGNEAGIFVSAVQPGSPASLQGLSPGDNILKVNDMDMKGVTREEAVLFLLSLQEQIDLIVQYSPDEYQAISTQHKGDSFHIKCHFHYMEPTKGEMSFRSGDVFHVVDTLHNGTVGAWQVFRIGRNNQEVQKGIIPNKARAEELATAQFNATKKELSTGSSESRSSFFRRKRSTHRRSKSLGKEHWDDVVFSDSISKFPAYERVILKHPGFVRPVVLFGPIADLARDKLLRDYPDKFSSPQLDNSMDDGKSKANSGIIRLSGIRAIMDRGKHALLDITPNAVDRLNYAQLYPIVVFLKADSKQVIKQLRQGIPKSAHKSSKKLLEQCQRMDRVWGHIFSQIVSLNETTVDTWYTKLTDLVQRSQSQQLWISETRRSEPLSDDFLFPMSTATESRLSYASSPESDVEIGGNDSSRGPRLMRASSDPSIATTQDNMDRENLTIGDAAPPPPPYTQGGYGDSKYGFSINGMNGSNQALGPRTPSTPGTTNGPSEVDGGPYSRTQMPHSPPQSPQGMYGHVPDLPPRIDRGVKPPGGVLLPGPSPGRNPPTLRHHSQNNNNNRPSAQERLFGTPRATNEVDGIMTNGVNGSSERQGSTSTTQGSLDRHRHLNNTNSYDSMSSYDSYAPSGLTAMALANARLGPNAPDDLKVGPRTDSNNYEKTPMGTPQRLSAGQIDGANQSSLYSGREIVNGNGQYNSAPALPYGRPDTTPTRNQQQRIHHTPDYNKYNNRNSAGPEYMGSIGKAAGASLYKPVPPPKPKHYRPPGTEPQQMPLQPHHAKSYSVGNGSTDMLNYRGNPNQNNNMSVSNGMINSNGPTTPMGQTNGYSSYSNSPNRNGQWQGGAMHSHSHSHPASAPVPPYHSAPHSHQASLYGGQNQVQAPPYNGPPPHIRGPPYTTSPHVIDLAGSREQRGSAFELYRKPQHMHNMSSTNEMNEQHDSKMSGTPKPKKKLSKKASFLRSITIDLFRSKTKKESKNGANTFDDKQKPILRREKSDLTGNSLPNSGKSRGLFRSNSSCDAKTPLKPILKRQTSFNEHNKIMFTPRDQVHNYPNERHLRRQNSLCDIESESKVKPLLRRQNSLIDYNRRNYNVITAIDPLYKRRMGNNMQITNEPIFQTKNEAYHKSSPNERIYVRRNDVSEPVYISKQKVIVRQTECPYASRQEVIAQQRITDPHNTSMENPYAQRNEMMNRRDGIYVTKQECCQRVPSESPYASKDDCKRQLNENPYGTRKYSESPYSTREECQRSNNSPYATKEEMLRQRIAGENPYGTKEGMLKHRYVSDQLSRNETPKKKESIYSTKEDVRRIVRESPYVTKNELIKCIAEEPSSPIKEEIQNENLYGRRNDSRRCDNENPYGSRSDSRRCDNENPYGSRKESKRPESENPYGCRNELRMPDYENPYGSRKESKRPESENPYGCRNEMRKSDNENPYGCRNEMTKVDSENPYGCRNEMRKVDNENPYGCRNEMRKVDSENPYGCRNDMRKVDNENPYGCRNEMRKVDNENPYGCRNEMRKVDNENPYGCRNELRKPDSENPYGSRNNSRRCDDEICAYPSRENTIMESPYKSRQQMKNELAEQMFNSTKRSLMQNSSYERPHSSKTEVIHSRQHSGTSQSSQKQCVNDKSQSDTMSSTKMKNETESQQCCANKNCDENYQNENNDSVCNAATLRIGENPTKSKDNVLIDNSHSVSGSSNSTNRSIYCDRNTSSNNVKSPCICDKISASVAEPCTELIENAYVSRQEILTQKAANKPLTVTQKFEMIKIRNETSKDRLYQSKREVTANQSTDEPPYVSSREVRDSAIYETRNFYNNARQSPYELSDVAHLSRRGSIYQTKQETMQSSVACNKPALNFDILRQQNLSLTDQEKQNTIITTETKILKGEPVYHSRLPPKQNVNQHQYAESTSTISVGSHFASELSMQFEHKPQSTPLTSQDLNDQLPTFKCNDKSTFNSSGDCHDSTVVSGPLVLDTDLLAIGQKGKIGGPDGPVTTWGIFDSDGGVLEDRTWGVSLIIPPDAILPGVKQKIYFTVTDPRHSRGAGGPPIDIDKGEAFLSPLVMCGPQGLGFARPVTLRLPHCANTLPSLGLTLNATDTEPGSTATWDNILLPATTTLNTVAVKVDHF